ncbi:hypothetical protein H9W90_07510 [Polaribacter pectinis]|uniref:tRNA_anti-like n=1 Tax=Polaribacter pectinis TaxID=2738844 RepID=A0A7G9LE99_9FLAO|nr:hypothetical protein [Polaribacter pectinis]QNM86948.1 hypothetical protein H9W90_07510 [Polaribacter pectinis]
MKKKNTPFYILIFLLLIVNGYYYVMPIFKNSNSNLEKVAYDIAINSDDLVNSYLSNEEKSNQLYAGKVIEVFGFVKEVTFLNNRNTVILFSKNNTSGVICDVNISQIDKVKNLQKHQKIKVKGICKGFLKDVVLLNCYIEIYE